MLGVMISCFSFIRNPILLSFLRPQEHRGVYYSALESSYPSTVLPIFGGDVT